MSLLPLATLRRWRYRTAPKAVILRYHRVADLASDPYDFGVSPSNFAEHCAVIRDRLNPVGLGAIVAGLQAGELPASGIAVTFDDGYRDALEVAGPVLQRHRVPATIFVVTGMAQGEPFWWDLLERILLGPAALPERFRIRIESDELVASLPVGEYRPADGSQLNQRWSLRSTTDPTERHRLLRRLHTRLVRLDATDRAATMDQLVAWAGFDVATVTDRPVLTAAEVTARRDDPLLDFGVHTVSHSPLSRLGGDRQRDEVGRSKRTLEGWLGRPATALAYPYGRVGSTAVVREAGFLAACGTDPGPILPGEDRWRLPRLRVGNWSGDELARRLEAQGL